MGGLPQRLPAIVPQRVDKGRARAQELGCGLLNRRSHRRRDALGIGAEVNRRRRTAHDASFPAVRISIRCMARICDPALRKPPAMFMRHPASQAATTSAPVDSMAWTLASIMDLLTSG